MPIIDAGVVGVHAWGSKIIDSNLIESASSNDIKLYFAPAVPFIISHSDCR